MISIELVSIDGIFLIRRKHLAIFFGISPQTLLSYSKPNKYLNPLEIFDKKKYPHMLNGREVWYDFKKAIVWHKNNILQKHSPKPTKYTGLQSEEVKKSPTKIEDEINIDNAREIKILEDARNERLKRKQEEIKLKVLKGEYIPAIEVDKSMTEISVLFISTLQALKDNELFLSRLSEADDVANIRDILDDEYSDLIEDIRNRVKNEKI